MQFIKQIIADAVGNNFHCCLGQDVGHIFDSFNEWLRSQPSQNPQSILRVGNGCHDGLRHGFSDVSMTNVKNLDQGICAISL